MAVFIKNFPMRITVRLMNGLMQFSKMANLYVMMSRKRQKSQFVQNVAGRAVATAIWSVKDKKYSQHWFGTSIFTLMIQNLPSKRTGWWFAGGKTRHAVRINSYCARSILFIRQKSIFLKKNAIFRFILHPINPIERCAPVLNMNNGKSRNFLHFSNGFLGNFQKIDLPTLHTSF